MARRPVPKRQIIWTRLAVMISGTWVTSEFSFTNKREAVSYCERNYSPGTKYKVWHARLRADYGIPRDFYNKSTLALKDQKALASK